MVNILVSSTARSAKELLLSPWSHSLPHSRVALRQSFLEVHNLTASCQKAFILGPKVPCRVGGGGGGARGQNLVHFHNVVFLHLLVFY